MTKRESEWYPTEAEIAEAKRIDQLCEEAAQKGWYYKSCRPGQFVFISIATQQGSCCLRTVHAETLKEAVAKLTPPRW